MSYAIIGAGAVGQALAKLFARKQIAAAIANRRSPEALFHSFHRRLNKQQEFSACFAMQLLLSSASRYGRVSRLARMLTISAMFSVPQVHSGTILSARLRPSGVSA